MYNNPFCDIMNVQYKYKQKRKIMEIGRKLKELRETESLTQQKLADILQIPRVNYTRYETNAARPDYETLIKIADFFDVSLDEIFDRTK
jgi:transcriptional regulator with XRE-family HTH domain